MSASDTAHHPALAHQFETLEQQRDTLQLGMWIFLVTEIMIFGGLFAAYTVYRYEYPVAFGEASGHMNWILAAVNTVLLISSSLTMALAVYGAETGNKKLLVGCLALTVALGTGFLVLKGVEYTTEFHEELTPLPQFFDESMWHDWKEAGINQQSYLGQVRLFLVLYYVMTGLHAIHMIIGIAILGVFIWMAQKGRFTPEYHPAMEMMGLYWHFVDVIWIFLFPLLYLLGTQH